MSQTVVPAAARSVITATPKTTFKVGTYSALNDTFTSVVDLNDHASYWLVKVDLAQPQKVYSRTSTIRAPGERITNWNYKNRHITVTLQLLYQSGTQALLTAVRSLLSAIENPPYRLAFAPPNSTVLTYADVVAVKHTIPSDAKLILNKAISNITIDFECAPGLAGDRITLQNLVVNPGFEAPSGPNVNVFNDTLVNTNAYTLLGGSAPSVTGNVMTIPNGATVGFGSPNWGALNIWQVRWQFQTGLTVNFYLHRTDANNALLVEAFQGQFILYDQVAGTYHNLSSTSPTYTANAWYWMVITQFPAAPGTAPRYQALLYNDSAGSIGSSIAQIGPVATFDATTNLSGAMAIACSGANAMIGGPRVTNPTFYVGLFGPGGWTFTGLTGSATGSASGAWEQNTSNTYAGGAVTSYGAARIDLPPAGTVSAQWETSGGGAPLGSALMPASTGQVVAASVYTKSTGLSVGATTSLNVREWDTNGALLRATTLQSVTGAQASYRSLSGTVTLGASTVYVSTQLLVSDTTAGASANGTVWFDNAQCWNQTTTGQAVMPYCELRFPQSPAQLMVSGLQGDMPAPAVLACGLYVSGTPASSTSTFFLGRRRYASAGAQLVFPVNSSAMAVNGGYSPTLGDVLDSSDRSGFYAGPVATGMSVTHGQNLAARDQLGIYHYFLRGYTANASPSTAVNIYNASQDYPVSTNLVAGTTLGTKLFPCTGGANWYWIDSGQVNLPVFPMTPQGDPTAIASIIGTPSFADSGHNNLRVGTGFLLPVDGEVIVAGLYNMLICSQNWLYVYADAQNSVVNYSLETKPVSNIANAAGGGRDTTGSDLSISSTGDTGLRLDPTATSGYASGTPSTPVNQFAFLAYDDNVTTFPVAVDFTYTPLYLYPRES